VADREASIEDLTIAGQNSQNLTPAAASSSGSRVAWVGGLGSSEVLRMSARPPFHKALANKRKKGATPVQAAQLELAPVGEPES
jgi:hypothetical protein